MSAVASPIAPTASTAATTANATDTYQLEATEAMCYHCFDVLVEDLQGKSSRNGGSNNNNNSWRPFRNNRKPSPTPDFVQELPNLSIECPLFITWEKVRPKGNGIFPGSSLLLGRNHHHHNNKNNKQQQQEAVYELRGCIGTLTPKPLVNSIGDYALTSALRDRRFHPVTAQEIAQLRVAVSLLVQYETCQNYLDWTVGVHGIVIRFWCHKTSREYSATYLPEVAQDQKWDQKAAVTALIRKAGYTGRIDPTLLDQIKCTRYQSSKRRMTFEEYMQRKQEQQQQQQQQPEKGGGVQSLPSTEPSSASSSFYHPDVATDDEGDEEQQQQLNHPPKQWNTCNNL